MESVNTEKKFYLKVDASNPDKIYTIINKDGVDEAEVERHEFDHDNPMSLKARIAFAVLTAFGIEANEIIESGLLEGIGEDLNDFMYFMPKEQALKEAEENKVNIEESLKREFGIDLRKEEV